MYAVTVQGGSPEELATRLHALADALTSDGQIAAPTARRTSKSAKPKPEEEDPFGSNEASEEASAGEEEVHTKESVEKALREVGSGKGIPAVKKILKGVKTAKVADIKEEDYAKVAEACEKALA